MSSVAARDLLVILQQAGQLTSKLMSVMELR